MELGARLIVVRRVVVAACVAASMLVLAGCGGTTSAAGSRSGTVQGQVLSGPSCPVERAESPCPPHPVARATVTASAADGSRVAEARTDDSGLFTLTLAPGTYRVAVSTALAAAAGGQTVTIRAGVTSHVHLMVDSGIR